MVIYCYNRRKPGLYRIQLLFVKVYGNKTNVFGAPQNSAPGPNVLRADTGLYARRNIFFLHNLLDVEYPPF